MVHIVDLVERHAQIEPEVPVKIDAILHRFVERLRDRLPYPILGLFIGYTVR